MRYIFSHPAKWRKYQEKQQKTDKRKQLLKKISLLVGISGTALTLLAVIFWGSFWISDRWSQASLMPPQPIVKSAPSPPRLSRGQIAALLLDVGANSAMLADELVCEKGGVQYTIRTTIDTKLQKYILKLLQRSRTLQSAVVVLNPADGRVVAMVDHASNGDGKYLSLKADYPAASLFKIVSAAAALENAGYTPDTAMYFRGRRHTLYKSQLKQVKDSWTTETTLRKAFALSNNAVFGKLGIYVLGQKTLAEYAEKFAFNQSIPFDLPLAVSPIDVPPDNFGLAEIASGFNKKTLISPLHASLLASAAANSGKMPTPWLVDTILDETDQVRYHAQAGVLNQPLTGKPAGDLMDLMEYAARSGTSRSAFRAGGQNRHHQ
jgi:peptidoglycan glycosyltransferase